LRFTKLNQEAEGRREREALRAELVGQVSEAHAQIIGTHNGINPSNRCSSDGANQTN
jgi:hypothetical protein